MSSTSTTKTSHGTAIVLHRNALGLKFSRTVVIHQYSLKLSPTPVIETPALLDEVSRKFRGSSGFSKFADKSFNGGNGKVFVIGAALPTGFSVKVSVADLYNAVREYTVTPSTHQVLKAKDLANYISDKDMNFDASPILSSLSNALRAQVYEKVLRSTDGTFCPHPGALPSTQASVRCGQNVEAWRGFLASIRVLQGGLALNVNTYLRAFFVPKVKLSDLMIGLRRDTHGVDPQWQALFGRLKITARFGPKHRTLIKAFGPGTAQSCIITTTKHGFTTVEELYAREYGVTLRHANDLPIINIGRAGKDLFVPAELCEVGSNHAGDAPPGTFTESSQKVMSRYSTLSPDAVAQIITRQTHSNLGLNEVAPMLRLLGVEVVQELLSTKGRVLAPPVVSYRSANASISNGSWSSKGSCFSQGADIQGFAVLAINTGSPNDFIGMHDRTFNKAVRAVRDACVAKGMGHNLESTPKAGMVNIAAEDLALMHTSSMARVRVMEEVLRGINQLRDLSPTPIIVFMLPTRVRDLYPEIKRLCDIDLGIPNVCILNKNVKRAVAIERPAQSVLLEALVHKMNVKLGGINHHIDTKGIKILDSTMLVGLSMNKLGKNLPTVTAAVSSCNDSFSLYPATIRFQKAEHKTIEKVSVLLEERVKAYQKNMNALPKNIVIFRVGSSDGELESILEIEKVQIVAAFKNVKADYNPTITIIFCGRGHHTRFFSPQSEFNKFENPKAGTVVDHGITRTPHVTKNKDDTKTVNITASTDFFLQAHHSPSTQLARPTRYSVIYTTASFSGDEIQAGINAISYLWEPSSRSVNLAPPARWAARAASHARAYAHAWRTAEENKKAREMQKIIQESNRGFVKTSLKETMFYI